MSKFKVGDTVVIVGVTDLDGEFVEAGKQITDPKHEITMDWRDPAQTLIGTIGTVTEAAMNDYYDITVQFDWNMLPMGREGLCFKEADAERVTAWRVIGTIPTPLHDPKRTAFDHDPSTRPAKTGKAAKPYEIGEAGRMIKVVTDNRKVADSLAGVWAAKDRDGKPLFENVKIEPVTA